MRNVLSQEPVASIVPSGENATETTYVLCFIVAIIAPVVRFVTRAVRSYDPVARLCPSGDTTAVINVDSCIILRTRKIGFFLSVD